MGVVGAFGATMLCVCFSGENSCLGEAGDKKPEGFSRVGVGHELR